MSRSYNKEEGYPSRHLNMLKQVRNSLMELSLGVAEAGYKIKFPDKNVSRRRDVGYAKRRKLPTPQSDSFL